METLSYSQHVTVHVSHSPVAPFGGEAQAPADHVAELLGQRWKVRVNYTRKIFFLLLALTATYLTLDLGESAPALKLLAGVIFLVFLLSLTEPCRRRSKLLRVAFSALDRPEDRPHTLLWLSTQTVATYLVAFGLALAPELLDAVGGTPLSERPLVLVIDLVPTNDAPRAIPAEAISSSAWLKTPSP